MAKELSVKKIRALDKGEILDVINQELGKLHDRDKHGRISNPERPHNHYLAEHSNPWQFFPRFIIAALPVIFFFTYPADFDSDAFNTAAVIHAIPYFIGIFILGITSGSRHTIYNSFALLVSNGKKQELLRHRKENNDFDIAQKEINVLRNERYTALREIAKPYIDELNRLDTKYRFHINKYGIHSQEADKFAARAREVYARSDESLVEAM